MPQPVIDLRKISRPTNPSISTDTSSLQKTERLREISWSAPEYTHHERGRYWFIIPGIVALGFAVFALSTANYFFAAFIGLAFVALALYIKKEPGTIACAISEEGVSVGTRTYRFAQIKSFWIFPDPETKELSLEMVGLFTPFLRIPLGDQDPEEVRDLLLRFVPQREHNESAADQITRALRF